MGMDAVTILLMIGSISHLCGGICMPQTTVRHQRDGDSTLKFLNSLTRVRVHYQDTFKVNCTTNDPEAEVTLSTKYSVIQIKKHVDNEKVFLDNQVFTVLLSSIADIGCYYCTAKSKRGFIQQTMVQVFPLPDMEVPKIEAKSQDVIHHTLEYGSSANFSCSGQGYFNLRWVRWYNNTHHEMVPDSMTETTSATSSATKRIVLKLEELREAWDEPVIFGCVVSHGEKNLTAFLNITIEKPERPEIQNFNAFMVTSEGSTFKVMCRAHGKPRPEFTWFSNGKKLTNCKDTGKCNVPGENYAIRDSHKKSGLEVIDATVLNTGVISCEASNGVGIDRAEMRLYVIKVPRNGKVSELPGLPTDDPQSEFDDDDDSR